MTYQVIGLMGPFKVTDPKNTLIIGINSGIGTAIAQKLDKDGHNLYGTTRSKELLEKNSSLAKNYYLDLDKTDSIDDFTNETMKGLTWDNLIFCPATMEPIGPFETLDISKWVNNFSLNFTSQIYLLQKLLKSRNPFKSKVLFFAGGGTNSSPKNYSCYTASKIALIKMVELLDNEIENTTFTILGPGWVKTKIHSQSLMPGNEGYESYKETKRRLNENDFVDINDVTDSIMWILNQPKEIVGGRNFSSVHDPWGSDELELLLKSDPHAFKLRRYANSTFQS